MIFLDLDGPVLDVSEKYFSVYRTILKELGYDHVSRETYWRAKRNRSPDESILAMTGAHDCLRRFRQERTKRIESEDFLALDILQPGARGVLGYLCARYSIALVTLRSDRSQLLRQLKSLNLLCYFDKILSSSSNESPRWTIKYRLITSHLNGISPKIGIIVGDTEADIRAGKEIGLVTVACANGIRTESLLRECNPDFLLPDIRMLPELFRRIHSDKNTIS